MRVLFAAPDRDLLQCYRTILEKDLGPAVTAFDGIQVLSALADGPFDAAVIDRSLPRIEYARLLDELGRGARAVIVLTDEGITPAMLASRPLPDAFLPYPFAPDALVTLVRTVLAARDSALRFPFAGTELDVGGFRIGETPVTLAEIETLSLLLSGRYAGAEKSVPVAALNRKFASARIPARIVYEAEQGFRLVSEDE